MCWRYIQPELTNKSKYQRGGSICKLFSEKKPPHPFAKNRTAVFNHITNQSLSSDRFSNCLLHKFCIRIDRYFLTEQNTTGFRDHAEADAKILTIDLTGYGKPDTGISPRILCFAAVFGI